MRKNLLSEIAVYSGQIKMPEYFEIDREEIFHQMLREGVNEQLKETPFTRELDKLRTYVREYAGLRHDLVLESFDTQSSFYFPHERSAPITHFDPMDPKGSPDYVCLYGVNVGEGSCKVLIEYDDNRRKGCVQEMLLNNNSFAMFPANLKYHFDKNRSEQLNCILVITYRKRS